MRIRIRQFILVIVLLILSVFFYLSSSFEMVSAGIAILLFGMMGLEEGFKQFSKGPLEKILTKATNKIYKSLALGFVSTAILQSSSLISIITISFLGAGLMTLTSGIGVIYGANIGSTTTAWIVALFGLKLNISAVAYPLIIFGILFSFQTSNSLKGIGRIISGLGFFFLGIEFMKNGFDAVQQTMDLSVFSAVGYTGVLIFTGIGIALTLILQSSSAAMAVVLTSLFAGQIDYLGALGLAIGANIGTTITALVGSLKSTSDGKRLAVAHLIFNLSIGILALTFIFPLKNLVELIAQLIGLLPDDYALRLAIFHSLFNFIGLLIMLPFLKPMSTFLSKLFIDKSINKNSFYLNENELQFTGTAITSLIKESKDLFENTTLTLLLNSFGLKNERITNDKSVGSISNIAKIENAYRKEIKPRYGKILQYSLKVNELELTSDQTDLLYKLRLANRKIIESIKLSEDIIPNFNRTLKSKNNSDLTEAYTEMCIKLEGAISLCEKVIKSESPFSYLELIKTEKKRLKKNKELLYKPLDSIVGRLKLDQNAIGSLVNDNMSINRLCLLLIQITELLFIEYDAFHQEDISN